MGTFLACLSGPKFPVKVIAGGAPFRFNPQLWEKVGADADGKNATDIVSILEKVVSGEND